MASALGLLLAAAASAATAAVPHLSIADFGARPGQANIAAAIARAIASCERSGGCVLTFPHAGSAPVTVYRASSFVLCSNLTLIVPPRVVLRGTEDDASNSGDVAWPTLPWLEHPSLPCNDCAYACGAGCGPAKRAWLYAHNVSNVTITGGGEMHGGGRWWWCARDPRQTPRPKPLPGYCSKRNATNTLRGVCPPRMIHLIGARDVVMRNISFTNSPFWMMHLQFCDDVLLDSVRMFNPNTPSYEAPNGDGVDIGSSRNIQIRNSVLDMADDQVCVRAGQGHAAAIQSVGTGVGEGRCGTHSVLVEDSEVRNGHGISLGSDGVGGVRNVTFRGIFINGDGPQGAAGGRTGFHGVAFGAVIFVKRDHGGEWQDLSWVNISGVDVNTGISIHEDHSNIHGDPPWPLPLPLPLGEGDAPGGPPLFSNLLFEDFVLRNVTRSSRSVNFAALPSTLRNLTLRRVHLQPVGPTARGNPAGGMGTSLGWSCATGDTEGSAAFAEKNVFHCEGCTAEDVEPPLVGGISKWDSPSSVAGRWDTGGAYNCSFQ